MDRLRAALVPGLPFVFSLILSLSTIGSHIYWQDSGFYLSAVHEMGVLYPHGFVLYQGLCKLWTEALCFVDFVLAVHLFSSLCAALAAGALALAARQFLPETKTRDLAAALAGCLAASGYTFWFAGIYAKVYALLYLLLALLLYAIVKAGAAPSTKDGVRISILAGLAWAAHPSMALGAPALAWFFLRVAKPLKAKTLAALLVPGLVAALVPGLFLPLLSAREVEGSMGLPKSASQVLSYLLGTRFTGIPGVFGPDANRAAGCLTTFWEEYLGIGLLLVGLGVVAIARRDRRLVWGGLLWILPFTFVTVLFRIEGQSDHWYLAGWLPLTLAAASGLEALAGPRPRGRALQIGAATLALAWSLVANYPDLNVRRYEPAETFGKLYLEKLDRNGVLFAQSDDVVAIARALQIVRGYRPDVLLVSATQLGGEELWYDRLLQRRHPELRLPSAISGAPELETLVASYLAANAGGTRPLYVTMPLAASMLPRGMVLVPQGVVWKLLPAVEDRIDEAYGSMPMRAEDVAALFRRKRGLSVARKASGFEVEYEPYERRLQRALLKARTSLADWRFRHGDAAGTVALYESVLAVDARLGRDETLMHQLSLGYLAAGRRDDAQRALLALVGIAERPWVRASSWLALGDLARARGDEARAVECYREAAQVPRLTPEQEAAVLQRLKR